MRRRTLIARLAAGVLALGAPGAVAAQGDPAVPGPAIRTINQSRLYADSRFAARVLRDLEAHAADVRARNARVQAALEAEEKALTEQRDTLPAATFRARARAFDEKVVAIREAQLRHQRALEAWEEAELRRFFDAARPVLLALMAETGAAVLLDDRSAVLARPELDLTDAALVRVDTALGDGADGAPALPRAPDMQPDDAAPRTTDPAQPAAPATQP